MRIIAGEFRSRLLATPADNETTRPIPDRVKESLFAILRGHTEDAVIFDAFAGTGAIGLEALSRGASRCVFVEKDKRIASILQKNIDTLRVGDRAELVIGDALGPGALARCPRGVNLVFFDPPYPLVREPIGFKRVMAQFAQLVARLDPKGYAILRTPWPFFLEVAEAPEPSAESGRPKKDRRAKERDRAMRDPDLAARYDSKGERSRGTPIPPLAEPPAQPVDDEEFDHPDLEALRAEFDEAEPSSDPNDPDRELSEAQIREMMNLPDARPLSEALAEAGLSGGGKSNGGPGSSASSRQNNKDVSHKPDEEMGDDDAFEDFDDDDLLEIDDADVDGDSELDDESSRTPDRSSRGKQADDRGAKNAAEPDIHLTPSRPQVQRLDATLAIPGARGPETHIYGSMAIHLYMRE